MYSIDVYIRTCIHIIYVTIKALRDFSSIEKLFKKNIYD